MKNVLLFLCVSATLCAQDKSSAHWPMWRGPAQNGCAPGAQPPVTWSESEQVRWKYKIPGFGTSSPVVWGDKIFITTAINTGEKRAAPAEKSEAAPPPPPPPEPDRRRPGRRGQGGFGRRGEAPTEVHQFVLLCINRKNGEEIWKKTATEAVPHEGHHGDHGFASASCVTDGTHVFAFFGSRGLFCYDLDGNKKWEKDLGDMRTRNAFGEGATPGLHGDTLVVNWDHEGEDFIVALDKNTGDERWRKPRNEPTTWTTPLILEHGGKAQAIVSATERIRSYDLKSGEQIWECGGMTTNVIPTPVAGFDHVYVMSGFRGAALRAIKLGKTGDLTDKEDAISWSHDDRTPYVPSPLLSGERLYFYSGNNALLSCLNAKTGEVHYAAERIAGLSGVYASPVAAAGRVYLAGRDGFTVVIKDDTKLEILATNKLDDKFDASPAIVGKDLLLRGHQHLYCLTAKE